MGSTRRFHAHRLQHCALSLRPHPTPTPTPTPNEVREYEPFEAASTGLVEGESDLVAGSLGLNAVSAFFFGGNAGYTLTLTLTLPPTLTPSSSVATQARELWSSP